MRAFLSDHPLLTFVLMGLSFAVFAMLSLDLAYHLKSNIGLFLDYGTMVIGDGALQQLIELLLKGYLALAFYLLFKSCEHILIVRMTEPEAGATREADPHPDPEDGPAS